ncbi:hypothetical protein [Aeromicrobium camelliae]|uniref:hypothetical protein n=1 Tax=Aeromicrobium camelliae TaxID=1538144 RepID=UPI000F5363E6
MVIEDIEREHDRRASLDADEALALLADDLDAGLRRVEKRGVGDADGLLRAVMRPRFWSAPVLSSMAARDPERFTDTVLDRFVRLANIDPEPRFRDDAARDVRESVIAHRLNGPVYGALAEALFSLAWSEAAVYADHVAQLGDVDHDASDELVCRTLAATQDSEAAIGWLLHRPEWYWLGWGHDRWPVMDVVAMHSGRCSDGHFIRLEDAILTFSPALENEECRGFGRYELLTVLDRERMSDDARRQLMELHHRFVRKS